MRAFSKYLPIVALLSIATVRAQPADPAAPAPAPAAPAPAPVAAKMSLADMSASSAQIEAQIKETVRHFEALRADARKEQDIIKLNCINDKYVQLKAQANLFDQSRQSFEASAANIDVAREHYTGMASASAKV